eukprot:CAMPEP_0175935990 /NCGR_PEP_ID=MMETSP0108-20121206/21372_2 /TAXON_ID=195067 ORGANISM="Goniomonas pacifica, Strain CCMP1869" /NCGR_SAMPLE_ID=MMETSP0108 /ASSEMBLY_ACC=CAM_ASM_000204 /LENGTH=139 /DNA_ID=CAMNT_0017260041 /DNA_START=41 /DNA_END=457 /DNA_ORIENTATION=-
MLFLAYPFAGLDAAEHPGICNHTGGGEVGVPSKPCIALLHSTNHVRAISTLSYCATAFHHRGFELGDGDRKLRAFHEEHLEATEDTVTRLRKSADFAAETLGFGSFLLLVILAGVFTPGDSTGAGRAAAALWDRRAGIG